MPSADPLFGAPAAPLRPLLDGNDALRPAADRQVLIESLAELRAESLSVAALWSGIVGYICLAFVLWPVTGGGATAATWWGAIALAAGSFLAWWQRRRHYHAAAWALLASVLTGAVGALLTFGRPELAYLLIVPVTLSSVLLSRWEVALTALASCALLSWIGAARFGLAPLALDVLLPNAIIVVVAVVSWLSARNLYLALGWVWTGYERAHANERLAREQQGELRRILKALDETNHRVERANYQAALARDLALQAQRVKQQFAQNISHELRTPLNLVVGFTELMIQSPEYYGGQLPAAYLRDLGIVHRNALHLQALVNDVLDLARIETAQMGLAQEAVDPGSLTLEAVNTVRALIESKGLYVRTEIEPPLPTLWIDPTRVRQILINLLNNAARYTDEGGVTVTVRADGQAVLFGVADTGMGIAEQDLTRIFEEFFQVDGSTRRRHGGVGLGLALCRHFVHMHEGRIWAESEPGGGSAFYFCLPTPEVRTEQHGPRQPLRAGAAPPLQADPVLLAVTSSPAAASMLNRFMAGSHLIVVEDMEQADQAVAQFLPQAVVVDSASVALGDEEAQSLAWRWKLPQSVVVVCPLPGEEPMRRQMQVEGYLIKPISQRGIDDTLRRFGENVEHVLVVDDNRDFTRLLRRLLESSVRRYQVSVAHTGREGLALMERRVPDLVLLDLSLPDMDGREVLALMRRRTALRAVPAVILTAQDESGDAGLLHGQMQVAKSEGLQPGETLRWLRHIVQWEPRDGAV